MHTHTHRAHALMMTKTRVMDATTIVDIYINSTEEQTQCRVNGTLCANENEKKRGKQWRWTRNDEWQVQKLSEYGDHSLESVSKRHSNIFHLRQQHVKDVDVPNVDWFFPKWKIENKLVTLMARINRCQTQYSFWLVCRRVRQTSCWIFISSTRSESATATTTEKHVKRWMNRNQRIRWARALGRLVIRSHQRNVDKFLGSRARSYIG